MIETLSKVEVQKPAVNPGAALKPSLPALGANVLRRIGAMVPPRWLSIARSGLSGVSRYLPAAVRHRLYRLAGLMGPDMGDVERDYAAWIVSYDTIHADTRRSIMSEIARMHEPPVISVLMPVFNAPRDHLTAAINSIQDQFYPWWELCIGDDASNDPVVAEILQEAAARDHRIKLVRRERNGHISAASNSALELATGAFVALLDHDDLLPPHALYEVAAKIIAQPDVDIIYSDEDHIDDEGRRSHPYFKPDWNPELMLGQNLISHLGVYRRVLMERIGGFRTGFEGSQDHDLALRVMGETCAGRIAHIPKVLYHWRQNATDRTFSEESHDRCVLNSRRAVLEFITRAYPGAKVEPAAFVPDWTRVVYPVPQPAPLVSVIVTWSGWPDVLAACDELLNRTDYPSLEILIQADDERRATIPGELATNPRIRVIGRGSSLAKMAAAEARGSLLLLLDSHLVPNEPGWLREMVSHAIRSDVGAVGPKLLSTTDTVRQAGIAVGGRGLAFTPFVGRRRNQAGYFGHLQLTRDVTAVTSKCLLVSRETFLLLGGLDEALIPAGFREVDFCLKLADAGLRTVWTPYAELHVREGAPRQRLDADAFKRGMSRMRQRWGQRLDADRFWSANLSPDSIGVRLAFPPRSRKTELPTQAVPAPVESFGPVERNRFGAAADTIVVAD